MDTPARKPFGLHLGALKAQAKPEPAEKLAAVDRVGEAAGFVPRDPTPPAAGPDVKRGPGRPASPRTAQLHPKVLPDVGAEIVAEATRRGVQQGVVIEEAWELYRAQVLRRRD